MIYKNIFLYICVCLKDLCIYKKLYESLYKESKEKRKTCLFFFKLKFRIVKLHSSIFFIKIGTHVQVSTITMKNVFIRAKFVKEIKIM